MLALAPNASASTRLPCLAYGTETFHYRLIVKFDTCRNLKRHRAVLPAIARLSCLIIAVSFTSVVYHIERNCVRNVHNNVLELC